MWKMYAKNRYFLHFIVHSIKLAVLVREGEQVKYVIQLKVLDKS